MKKTFNEGDGVWRTVGGKRIFIADGEDLKTAMKNSGKFDNILKNKDKLNTMEKMDAVKNELTKLKKEGKLSYDGRTTAKTQTTLDYDMYHLSFSEYQETENDITKQEHYNKYNSYAEKQMKTIKSIDGVGEVKGKWQPVYVPMRGYAMHYRITIKSSK